MSNRDFKLKMDKIQLISYKLGSFPVFLIQQMALPSTQLLKQETYVTLGFSLSPSLITAGQLLSPINYTFLNVIQISPLLSIQWPPCSCLPGLLYLPPVNWSPWAPLIKFPFSPHASSPPIHFLHSSQNYLPKRNYILWLLKTLQLVGTTLWGEVLAPAFLSSLISLAFSSAPAMFFQFLYFHCLDPLPSSYKGNWYAFLWFQSKHFLQEVRSPRSVYMAPWADLIIESAGFVVITRLITYFSWIVGTVFFLVFLLSVTVTGHDKLLLNVEGRKGKRRKNIKWSRVQNLHTF